MKTRTLLRPLRFILGLCFYLAYGVILIIAVCMTPILLAWSKSK